MASKPLSPSPANQLGIGAMTTLVIPSVVKRNALSVVGNGLFVHGRLVDPDAEFINAITDRQVNGFIGEFSRCYVVDVTSHCNMSCRYCYYKVDNTTVNRSVSTGTILG